MPVIPALERLRKEDWESRPAGTRQWGSCLKTEKLKKKKKHYPVTRSNCEWVLLVITVFRYIGEWSSDTGHSMIVPWRHYARRIQGESEKPHVIWLCLHERSRIGKSQNSISGYQEFGGEGEKAGRNVLRGTGNPIGERKKKKPVL